MNPSVLNSRDCRVKIQELSKRVVVSTRKKSIMTHPVDVILPDDLVMEIFMKIPARFLVGLRCVCKSWNALITHPQFVSKFFSRNNNTRKFILFRDWNHSFDHKYVAMFRVNEQPRILYDIDPMSGRNSFNFSDCFKQCIVDGSINGIICLFDVKLVLLSYGTLPLITGN